jgi:hypothetical protein
MLAPLADLLAKGPKLARCICWFSAQGWQEEFACVADTDGGPSLLRSSGRPAEGTNVCFNARL